MTTFCFQIEDNGMSEEKNLIKMRNYLKNLIIISIFGLTAISLYLGIVHRINLILLPD